MSIASVEVTLKLFLLTPGGVDELRILEKHGRPRFVPDQETT